jgi:hypothetical protein
VAKAKRGLEGVELPLRARPSGTRLGHSAKRIER